MANKVINNDPDRSEATSSEEEKGNDPDAQGAQREGISGLQVLQSTLAAALGVQSSKNRQRDFTEGRASQFIIAGIVFTALFVGLMVLIVNLVLS